MVFRNSDMFCTNEKKLRKSSGVATPSSSLAYNTPVTLCTWAVVAMR